MPRYYQEERMNPAVFLAVSAGVATALQVVVNSVELRDLGLGAPICISGATTAVVGLAWELFAVRAEATGRVLLYALASELLGAFTLGSIVLAANRRGLAQTLSICSHRSSSSASAIDRPGASAPSPEAWGSSTVWACC
jgi:hypothetical protein